MVLKGGSSVWLVWLSLIATILAVMVVILGAYTRLVHAGLGCPDWPTCYGHLWIPQSAQEITQANQAFSETPVETDKTWPEQIHRLFASSLGLVCLILLAGAWRVARQCNAIKQDEWILLGLLIILVSATVARMVVGDYLDSLLVVISCGYFIWWGKALLTKGREIVPLQHSFLLAGLVVLQGLFGMWTVTLKLWPQVVTVHLLGGFSSLTLLWLLHRRWWALNVWVYSQYKDTHNITSLKKMPNIYDGITNHKLFLLTVFVVCLVIFQIGLGGWTSANYAAMACPDFPLCQQQWLPATDFQQGFNFTQAVGPNYLGGLMDGPARTAIHLVHRLGAVILSSAICYLFLQLWRSRDRVLRRFGLLILVVLFFQVGLGVSNVVFSLPLPIAVMHNAVGALLLMTVSTLALKLRPLPILADDLHAQEQVTKQATILKIST